MPGMSDVALRLPNDMRKNKRSRKLVRVTIHQSDGNGMTMKIEGSIAGSKVLALKRAWQELAASLGERTLLVDLRGVLHLDGAGRNLLAEIHAKTGAEFVADTPLTKYFAEQARQGIRTRSED
jgi:ABC-type transporter Mla MlaB component